MEMIEPTYIRTVRKPTVGEVPAIKRLIDQGVREGAVLPRPLIELYENVRDFQVYEDDDGIAGCCALHIDLADLAEIRSLIVLERLRGQGIGRLLVNACLEEARQLSVPRVYALTRVPEFFFSFGFCRIAVQELPHKVFRDCVRCQQFTGCDETAVVRAMEVSIAQNSESIQPW